MKQLYTRFLFQILLCAFLSAIAQSCVSVREYNAHLKAKIPPAELRKDVDFAVKKLQTLHPDLYRYLPEEQFVFKMDSLKNSFQEPLTPQEFFDHFQPVVAQIRQGHLTLMMPVQHFTKKELKRLKLQKGLLSRMKYWIENDTLFVKSNTENFENIKVGTQILKINDQPVQKYLDEYSRFITGDGFNTTFKNPRLAQIWPNFFTAQIGIKDSLKIETVKNDSIRDFYIHRKVISKDQAQENKKEIKDLKKEKNNRLKDYNTSSGEFNRFLQFVVKDSSIAYMRIRSFSGTLSEQFYKKGFENLKKAKTQYLIIDVRDNLGGSLEEIKDLYSYFVNKPQPFIDKIQVKKKGWAFAADYFSGMSSLAKPFAALVYPFYELTNWLSTTKKGNDFYAGGRKYLTDIRQPKKNNFQGEVYLLINGSSFSASAIIAAKFKNDHRAILVGEETGGANDGTVAGRYATRKLPYSKMVFPIPLMLIKPDIQFTHTEKGVVPDFVVIPTKTDIFNGSDTALKWIFRHIENLKIKKTENH